MYTNSFVQDLNLGQCVHFRKAKTIRIILLSLILLMTQPFTDCFNPIITYFIIFAPKTMRGIFKLNKRQKIREREAFPFSWITAAWQCSVAPMERWLCALVCLSRHFLSFIYQVWKQGIHWVLQREMVPFLFRRWRKITEWGYLYFRVNHVIFNTTIIYVVPVV